MNHLKMDRRLFWANVSAFLHYETINCKACTTGTTATVSIQLHRHP